MSKQALYTFAASDTQATFHFRNGDSYVIPFNALTAALQQQAMVHGIKQKVIDAAAIPRNTETGYAAPDSQKIDAMIAVIQRLLGGEWNATREGGGTPTGGMLLQALIEAYPTRTRDQLVAFLAGKSAAEKAALRASPKLAPIIDRIRASRASTVDADELLEGLDD